MMKEARLAFLLLAHEPFEQLHQLIDCLVECGEHLVIHYDARGKATEFQKLERAFGHNPKVSFAKRVKCGWGDFSLVQATLNCIEALVGARPEFDYAYLLSGSDMPLRPISELKRLLGTQPGQRQEFIESVPISERRWVRGGLNRERFEYRHFFNERRYPQLFTASWTLQRDIGLVKRVPRGLEIHLGSQWWCLTSQTLFRLREFLRDRPEVLRFFKTVWIPDESFFQTVVRAVAASSSITGKTLTHYVFSDYGKPIVYFDEHQSDLVRTGLYFGRKISPTATGLRTSLAKLACEGVRPNKDEPADLGPEKFSLLRQIGRRPSSRGRVFGASFLEDWEPGPQLDLKDRYLVILIAQPTDHIVSQDQMSSGQLTLAHGHLFGPRRIEFAFDAEYFAGYRVQDIEIAREDPVSFLTHIAKAAQLVTAFKASWSDVVFLSSILGKNSHVLFLDPKGDENQSPGPGSQDETYLDMRLSIEEAYETGRVFRMDGSLAEQLSRSSLPETVKAEILLLAQTVGANSRPDVS
jgi:hypothetical protein